jgi:hypothetical protein
MPVGDKGAHMDTAFWAGIILGGLVSFPVAIVANLYSEQVREYLDRRRVVRLNRKRSSEIAVHERLLRLINGDPTQTLLHAEHQLMMIMSLLVLCMCYGFLFGLAYFRKPILIMVPKTAVEVAAIALLLFSGTVSLLVLLIFSDYRNTMRKIRRFSDYEAQIRAKWGEDAI